MMRTFPFIWIALLFLSSTTLSWGQTPSVSMSFPQFNSSYIAGTSINLQATATTPAGTSITKVEFFVQENFTGGYTKIGEDDSSPYSLNWTAPTPAAPSRSYQLKTVVTNSASLTAIANAGTGYVGISVYRTDFASSRNWYVSAAASSTNTAGTEASPFNTIQKAADRVAPGDIVYVMAGDYTGTGTNIAQVQRTGLPDKWILFTPYNNDKPRLVMGNNNWNGFNILPAAAYIKIQGFEVLGNNPNLTLTDARQQPGACEGPSPAAAPIAKFNGNGISISGRTGGNLRPHHVVINNNKVHDCAGAGISSIEGDYITIEDNSSYNNSWYTVYGTSGFSIFNSWNSDNATETKIIVRRNISYGNILKIAWNIGGTGTNCKFYDGNGIILDNNNAAKNPLGAYTGKFLLENNICYLNGGRGINVNYSDNAIILNNTTYRNGVSDGGPGVGIESEFIAQGANSVSVYNNIFSGRPGEKVTEVNASVITHNNNLTFEGTGTPYFSGNQNIVGQNPQFVDAANGNFQLMGTSPAINAGSSVSGQFAAKDILGIDRPQGSGVDIGAYELQGTPISITQQPASSSAVCAGATVSVSVGVSGPVQSYQWYKNGNAITGVTSATTATLTLSSVSAADQGGYSVGITGFNSLTSSAFNLTVNALPTATLTPASATLTCASPSVTLSASGGASYSFSTGETTSTIVVTNPGTYTVTITDANGCSATATTTVTTAINTPQGIELVAGSAISCTTPSVTLTGSSSTPGVSYTFSGPAISAQSSNTAIATQAGTYSVLVTSPEGCTASGEVTVLGGLTTPDAPDVSSVSATQGAGTVNLTVTNCAGTVSWNGVDGSASFAVSTTAVGEFVYAVTCKVGVCISSVTSVTVSVKASPATLSVSHRDGDNNQPANNTIRPYLKLYNEGVSAIPYSDITIRYWLTVEDFSPLTNLSVYWAQIGTNKVRMRYVPLNQPRQGALGYIEYSFDASAGNLAANSNSGEIQTGIGKQNWTNLIETDDYSFASNTGYTKTDWITVYRNGVLAGGTEPALVPAVTALKIYAQNRNSSSTTNQISTYLKVANEGNLPVDYSQVTIRYWFSAEGANSLVYTVDYAELGNASVKGRFIKENRVGADTYLEVSFVPGLGQLQPLSSTGIIQQRVNKNDWSNFNEANDYSYKVAGALEENAKITAYLNGSLVYGQEPASGARLRASGEPGAMRVTLLGNPIQGNAVQVVVEGAEGQSVRFELIDARGQLVHDHRIEQAGATERLGLPVGQASASIFLLRVSTQKESQTLKFLKP